MTAHTGLATPRRGRPRPEVDLLAVYEWRAAHDAAGSGSALKRRLNRVAWMLSVARGLPWARIELSQSSAGKAIDSLLRNRSARLVPTAWRARVGYCVLELPPTLEEYLGGPQRRRLRKRLSRANQKTVAIRSLTDAQRDEVERSLLTEVDPKKIANRGSAQLWLGAFDDSPEPLAVAIALIDEDVAMLHTSQGNLQGREIDIRYVLHTKLVECLIESGVNMLITDSQNCFRTPLMLLQYQYQLGYVVRNLVWRLNP